MIHYIQRFWNEPNSNMMQVWIEQMQQHPASVEVIVEIQNIRISINHLASIDEMALLLQGGVVLSESASSSDSEEDSSVQVYNMLNTAKAPLISKFKATYGKFKVQLFDTVEETGTADTEQILISFMNLF